MRKLAVLAVATASLSACGKQSASTDNAVQVDTNIDARALAVSADHTTQAGTGKVDLTMKMGMNAGSGSTGSTQPSKGTGGLFEFSMTGHGAYDNAAKTSTMSMDLGSMFKGITSALPDGAKGSIPGSSGDMTEEIVQVGSTIYMRMPMLAASMPSVGDKWIHMDGDQIKALGSGSGSSSPLGVSGFSDPAAMLAYLKGAGADVTTVGHEQINGVDTTHAHATLSMKQAMNAAGADRSKIDESLKNMPGGMGDAFENLSFPVDVFIDSDGYVRRLSISYDLGSLFKGMEDSTRTTLPRSGGFGMNMTMTLDYHDFGQPVTITAPPDDQTVSMCELLQQYPAKTQTTLPAGVC